MVGYSGKSLIQKLDLKTGQHVLVVDAPEPYAHIVGVMPEGVTIHKDGDGPFDVIHYFCKSREDLELYFPDLKSRIKQDGMLWISWIKGSSGVITDINENIVMQVGLKHGLVDVKVIAVDETWSALKFVYRLKDRK
jgi:hypothetical protein